MGNWNELTITPENGEELHLEGGKSAKFGMQDYIDFVCGFIASHPSLSTRPCCACGFHEDFGS